MGQVYFYGDHSPASLEVESELVTRGVPYIAISREMTDGYIFPTLEVGKSIFSGLPAIYAYYFNRLDRMITQ